jgi:sugar lactone lactonase YvrE
MRLFAAMLVCVFSFSLCAIAGPNMVFDKHGNLFFADHYGNTILKFAPDGTNAVFADKVSLGSLAIGADGNLFVAVSDGSGTIYKFGADGSTSVFASGVGNPSSLASDAAGNLFAFDMDSGSIFKFGPDGRKSTFKEGTKPAGQTFARTLVLAGDRSGNLFVGDQDINTIFKFAPNGTRKTFATKVPVNDLAVDSTGDVFAANFSSSTIFKFAPDGSRKAIKTKVTAPEGLAVDSAGNVFVWDEPQQKIDKVTADGATIAFAENKPMPAPTEPPKSDAEREAAGEDTSVGLPPEYAKDYLVAQSTISPDKKLAVIYPRLEVEEAAEDANHPERIKDYLVSLQPFAILKTLDTKWPQFEHKNHGGISAEWSDDSSVALVTLDSKWGPQDVFLVELRAGNISRITNLLAKAHDLLLPNYRSAKATRYNDYYDFVFVEDTTFKLEGVNRVVIDGSVETSPNIMEDDLHSSDRAWRGHVQAVWDIAQAKFASKEVSGGLRGTAKKKSRH